MDMFITLIVVIVSKMCLYVKIYQIVYFKYVQFIASQLYQNKIGFLLFICGFFVSSY